jgi:hypothetical protein
MKTTAHSSARYAVQLIGTLAVNAALLLVGVRLTGFAWEDVCFLLLPPMMASAGAGFAILVLDRMALRSAPPAVATFSLSPTWVKAARSC